MAKANIAKVPPIDFAVIAATAAMATILGTKVNVIS
jgi:hypothetical protein